MVNVTATSPENAFAPAAAISCNLNMVVVAREVLLDDDAIAFPSESIVDTATALEQPEVFDTGPRSHRWRRGYSLRVSNSNGQRFEDKAATLVDELDAGEILQAVHANLFTGADQIEHEQALFNSIHASLVKQGTIEF